MYVLSRDEIKRIEKVFFFLWSIFIVGKIDRKEIMFSSILF